MTGKLFLPALAGSLLAFAVAYAVYTQQPNPEGPPPMPPPTTPFGDTVAGAGMVEPSTESSGTSNIAVGSQLAGVVTKVLVRIGQTVKAGDPLFELDKSQTEADLRVRTASLAVAKAQLHKLRLEPRPEEVPASEAQVAAAAATLREKQDVRDRNALIVGKGAVSPEDMVASEQALRTARAQLALAKANLALLKAGAWEPDKAIAAANAELARAQVEQAKTTLALLEVRAPVDGTVLQVNVRPGEYVSTFGGQSLILMGSLLPLHVRVNVDEEDIPRLKLDAPARAVVRGDVRQESIPMRFVRLEPYVVPKTSLTGSNVERVDTRVAQLIYAMDPENELVQCKKVLVGQLVDVFIDTRPTRRPHPSPVTSRSP